jgi:hypothetical protein
VIGDKESSLQSRITFHGSLSFLCLFPITWGFSLTPRDA